MSSVRAWHAMREVALGVRSKCAALWAHVYAARPDAPVVVVAVVALALLLGISRIPSRGACAAPKAPVSYADAHALCAAEALKPGAADACGTVLRPNGTPVYCLFAAPQPPLTLIDPRDVALSGAVRRLVEMDAPCASERQHRDRHTHARVSFGCCPPVDLENATAFCFQHLRETDLVGWPCAPVTGGRLNEPK